MKATELVHHTQPIAQKNECQEILGQQELNVRVNHLAGTPHLADDLPNGVTDITVACSSRSSLLLLVSQRKNDKAHLCTSSCNFLNGVRLL
jgi:hypothetical protein